MSDPVDWNAWLVTRCRSEAESVRGVFPSIGDALDQAADALEAAEAKLCAIIALPNAHPVITRSAAEYDGYAFAMRTVKAILHPEEEQ